MPDSATVIYIFGEGKTDIGQIAEPEAPDGGVVTILTHTLCGNPPEMLVQRRALPTLQGKGLWQKVRFAKREAYRTSAGAVFVVDSEGDTPELKKQQSAMRKGRDSCHAKFPMAVGVAHPCIEGWLLADASAIERAMSLSKTPQVPDEPEQLPAPCQDRRKNPKTELARVAGSTKGDLAAKDKDNIASKMDDIKLVCTRCPQGFAPFADEVQRRIRPLF